MSQRTLDLSIYPESNFCFWRNIMFIIKRNNILYEVFKVLFQKKKGVQEGVKALSSNDHLV